jgi:hypothetical protein
MKYFFDTEFLEGIQERPLFLKGRLGNLMIGYPKPTIDLIGIGIVAEDGREYYAISKDFNLKEAWNRWQQRTGEGDRNIQDPRLYWLRENVLFPIFKEFLDLEVEYLDKQRRIIGFAPALNADFNHSNFKRLLNKYGKSNKQIAEEVKKFCQDEVFVFKQDEKLVYAIDPVRGNPEFYAYYADYDWVVFCWLFGEMMDLPKGFPMYCKDLKQILDEKINALNWNYGRDCWSNSKRSISTIGKGDSQEKDRPATFEEKLITIKKLIEYPKQENEHNAIADARWNRKLHEFLISI